MSEVPLWSAPIFVQLRERGLPLNLMDLYRGPSVSTLEDGRPATPAMVAWTKRENIYWTYDVGPETSGVQRGLEMKDLRNVKDLTS